jgi:hypothetical protein
MGKLLTILGISDEVQDKLPNDVLEGEQFLNVLQTVYEQSPESAKKEALANAIAENVRLLLAEVAKVKIDDKKQPTGAIPSTDPSTWNGTFNVGDKVKIRIDMSMNLNIPYDSPDNEFTIVSIESGAASPFQLDSRGNNIGGLIRPENPSGLLYLLNNNGGQWEGKDLELVEKGTNQPPAPQPPAPQPTPTQPTPPQPTPPSSPSPKKPKAPKKPKVDKEKERIKKDLQEQIDEIRQTLVLFKEEEDEYQELQNELDKISQQINQLNN